MDSSTFEPFKSSISEDNVRISLGSFQTGGFNIISSQVFLSSNSRKQGWTYLILEPGIYYLGFTGRELTGKDQPRYRIDINPESPIVYIGTMHLQCHSKWNIFGIKKCDSIDSHAVVNEEALAKELVSENLEEMGHLKSSLMQLHTEKTLIFRTPRPKK